MNRLLLLALTVFLTGCLTPPSGSSAPTRYYRLSAPSESSVTDNASVLPAKVLLKVSLADLIQTPRMALAASDYEISYRETQRFAEPFDLALGKLLRDCLKLSVSSVEAVPASVNFAPDYRVEIFVEKAWGTTKGEVVLAARWNISDSHGTIVATDAAVFSQKGWRESDFKGLAERLSRLGAELAKAIQKDLSSLDEKAKNT